MNGLPVVRVTFYGKPDLSFSATHRVDVVIWDETTGIQYWDWDELAL